MALYFSANQETLAALVQFFSTSFSTGDTRSFTDSPSVLEDLAEESLPPQPYVSVFRCRECSRAVVVPSGFKFWSITLLLCVFVVSMFQIQECESRNF